MDNIRKVAEVMADTIQAGRWVHTFGCGHATPDRGDVSPHRRLCRISSLCELPYIFTHITGEMGIDNSSSSKGPKAMVRPL